MEKKEAQTEKVTHIVVFQRAAGKKTNKNKKKKIAYSLFILLRIHLHPFVLSILAPNEKLAVKVTLTPFNASIYHLKDFGYTLYHRRRCLASVCYYLLQSGDFTVLADVYLLFDAAEGAGVCRC